MADALLDRGHEVVMFSPFPRKTPRANYTDVNTSTGKSLIGSVNYEVLTPAPAVVLKALPPFLPVVHAYFFVEYVAKMGGDDLCRHVFSMPELHKVRDKQGR